MGRNDFARQLERNMRRTTAAVSAVAILLMIGGFAITMTGRPTPTLPGPSAMPASAVWRLEVNDPGLWAMSAGILLLAIIPALRVLLSLYGLAMARRFVDAAIAGIILLELLLSTRVR